MFRFNQIKCMKTKIRNWINYDIINYSQQKNTQTKLNAVQSHDRLVWHVDIWGAFLLLSSFYLLNFFEGKLFFECFDHYGFIYLCVWLKICPIPFFRQFHRSLNYIILNPKVHSPKMFIHLAIQYTIKFEIQSVESIRRIFIFNTIAIQRTTQSNAYMKRSNSSEAP